MIALYKNQKIHKDKWTRIKIIQSTRSQLINFFLIAFGWSCLINLPRVLANFEIISLPPTLSTIMGYIAVFGPMAAAFLLTYAQAKKGGVKALWKSG
jgi:hypothetical protein